MSLSVNKGLVTDFAAREQVQMLDKIDMEAFCNLDHSCVWWSHLPDMVVQFLYVTPNFIFLVQDTMVKKSNISPGDKLLKSIHQYPLSPLLLFSSGLGFNPNCRFHFSADGFAYWSFCWTTFTITAACAGCQKWTIKPVSRWQGVAASSTKVNPNVLLMKSCHLDGFFQIEFPLRKLFTVMCNFYRGKEDLGAANCGQTSLSETLHTIPDFGCPKQEGLANNCRGAVDPSETRHLTAKNGR